MRVTFLAITKKVADCQEGIQLNAASKHNINFTCLEDRHFLPEVSQPHAQRLLFPKVLS